MNFDSAKPLTPNEERTALHCHPWEMDDSDYRMLSDRFVVTRKPSKCAVCFSDIPAKSRVRARTEVCDGDCQTFKFCPECCWCMAHRDDYSEDEGDIGLMRWEGRYDMGRANAEAKRKDATT